MGVAFQDRGHRGTFVALPVTQPESATGRAGLVTVLGVASSIKPGVPDALVSRAIDVITDLLPAVFPGGTLLASADAMTRALQTTGPHETGTPVAELTRQIAAWAHCLTFLAQRCEDSTIDHRPAAASAEPAAVLAHMLHTQLFRTGHEQTGAVHPVDFFDGRHLPPGCVTDYRFIGRDLYFCQLAQPGTLD